MLQSACLPETEVHESAIGGVASDRGSYFQGILMTLIHCSRSPAFAPDVGEQADATEAQEQDERPRFRDRHQEDLEVFVGVAAGQVGGRSKYDTVAAEVA